MFDELLTRREIYFVAAGPFLQQRKVWGDEGSWELALVAEHHRFRDQGIVLERVLDWLRSDEFSA